MSKKSRLARQQQQGVAVPGQAALIAQKTEIRSAPIPDPEELQRYRDFDPDLYALIKAEYAKNGEHRRVIEREFSSTQKTLIRGITRNDTFGILASWSFALLCVGGAFYFMSQGQEIGGLIALVGVLPPLVAAFRRRSKT